MSKKRSRKKHNSTEKKQTTLQNNPVVEEKKEDSQMEAEPEKKPEEGKAEAEPEEKPEESKAEAEPEKKPEEGKAEAEPEKKPEESKAEAEPEKKPEEGKAEAEPEKKPEESKAEAEPEEKPEEDKAEAESEEKPEEGKAEAEPEEKPEEPYVVDAEKVKKRFPVWAIICIACFVLLAGAYGAGVIYFSNHFGWNTTLNGIDVSGFNEERTKAQLDQIFYNYSLTIEERGDETETISAEEIDLDYSLKGTIREELQKQNQWLWFMSWFEATDLNLEADVNYDLEQLRTVIHNLECMDRQKITYPSEPKIVKKSNGYILEDGVEGDLPMESALQRTIIQAIDNLYPTVNLEEKDCYVKLKYHEDDPQVQTALNSMNTINDLKITYDFGDDQMELKGSQISSWATINRSYEVELDTNAMHSFLDSLNEEYTVSSHEVDFDTHYGSTVTIDSYIIKAVIDQENEVEKLQEIIEDACETGKTEFTRSAENMFSVGDTYIEINLTAQRMFCYKDGKVILETDIVSGRPSTGCATPPGIYNIFRKASPAILVGATYRTPVSYWMPFNGGIGLHDATWQSAFGGMRYLTNGSHGCINLRLDVAKFLYENYEVGDLVILYHMEGTESSETTPAGRACSSPIPVHTEAPTEEATEAPATEPSVTEPPVSEPSVTEPSVTEPSVTEPPAPEPPATVAPTTEPPAEVSAE